MQEFKDIPPNMAGKIVCYVWGCGDECQCQHTRIYFIKNNSVGVTKQLWDSDWINFEWNEPYHQEYLKDLDNVRKETIEACDHYGIKYKDLESDCIWDWEFEDKIIS